MGDFSEWLNNELLSRGWSQTDLGRKSKISDAQISRVCSGLRPPGIDFCKAIANALQYEPVYVMEMAGLVESSKEHKMIPGLAECIKTYENMSEEDRKEILTYMKYLFYKKRFKD